MESWKRKLRMGMVGGGQGAFIGGVHRIAATLDQQVESSRAVSRSHTTTRKLTGRAALPRSGPLLSAPTRRWRRRKRSSPADKRIDFVSIVTPNDSHFPIARTFLNAGFHVVCDKPMTYTLAEAEELVQLVERTGLVFA